jgi:hypothetical protein
VQQSLIQYRIHDNQVTKKSTYLSNKAKHAALTNFRLINAGEDQLPDLYESVEDWYNSKAIEIPKTNLAIFENLHTSKSLNKIYRFFRNPLWGTKRVLVKIKLLIQEVEQKRNINDKIQNKLKTNKSKMNPTYLFWITCALIINPKAFGKIILTKSKKTIVKIGKALYSKLTKKNSREK